jgi:hypothetical protein
MLFVSSFKCSVLRTFKGFKRFKNFKCECEELTSVCTQDGELIVIEWKVQQDATIKYLFVILYFFSCSMCSRVPG